MQDLPAVTEQAFNNCSRLDHLFTLYALLLVLHEQDKSIQLPLKLDHILAPVLFGDRDWVESALRLLGFIVSLDNLGQARVEEEMHLNEADRSLSERLPELELGEESLYWLSCVLKLVGKVVTLGATISSAVPIAQTNMLRAIAQETGYFSAFVRNLLFCSLQAERLEDANAILSAVPQPPPIALVKLLRAEDDLLIGSLLKLLQMEITQSN
ncbi:hypothetical protein Ciccas_002970 [Cichlidogyrus casuarinus]|uniref:Uncharacterized protein n=1 Tax=Cichlidogyrus casuarinus TaxID=1844966 RepID=A0ABD2QGN7_9PLAT